MKRNKQAISLIVLVITIIVMVILAGAIILTLNNSGIINKAQDAVKQTNEATVKEVATLGWAEAYADGARTEEELREGVEAALEKNNIDPEDYGMIVTTSGVTISKGWLKDGFTVVKGSQTLEIGDSIAYDETAGGTKTVTTNVDWKVLGADEEGNLLIMSSTDVSSFAFAGNTFATVQNDWITVKTQLDTVCESYSYGEGVVGQARSITVEDVNKVTGYAPETALYGKGNLWQYGNEVTYSYNGTTKPAYTSATASGTLTSEHANGFHYYNGKKFVVVNDLISKTSGTIAKIKSTNYSYTASTLTTISKENNAKAYSMVFGAADASYWLATPTISTTESYVSFETNLVAAEGVRALTFGDSIGNYNTSLTSSPAGVRAVVTLSKDITLTGDSTNGWSY